MNKSEPLTCPHYRIGLETPWSLRLLPEELSVALAQTKQWMAPWPGMPWPDGFNLTYYYTFSTILTPHFLTAYNALKCSYTRREKDQSQCGNCHPIAVLNMDLKLFSKILSNRLLLHIPKLIHLDRMGYLPLREAGEITPLECTHLFTWPIFQEPSSVAFHRCRQGLQQSGLALYVGSPGGQP